MESTESDPLNLMSDSTFSNLATVLSMGDLKVNTNLKSILRPLLLFAVLATVATTVLADQTIYDISDHAPKGTLVLMKEARTLALKSTQCGSVTMVSFSTSEELKQNRADGTIDPNDPNSYKNFFVTCNSSTETGPLGGPAVFNLYYSYADLRQHVISQRPNPVSDDVAIKECKDAILGKLKFPSSARMSLIRYGTNGTDNQWVRYDFTALNGFGNRIPQKGDCVITPKNVIDVSITNR